MSPGKKNTAVLIILFIFIFSLGFSLTANFSTLKKNFLFADEAVYYAMTQSLVEDGDLEYTRQDLIRYYSDFGIGPIGIFLKKGKEGKIFFGKSMAYPVFAAPFYMIFGINGFLVFHSVLLFLLLLMGYSYYTINHKPVFSLMVILTFLFASVAAVYFLWLHPDFFNLFLAFAVLYLWKYKHAQRESEGSEKEIKGRFRNLLMSNWSDYLACFLAGVAVYSKPPSIFLFGLLLSFTLVNKKFVKSLVMVLIFILISGIFWGANQRATGDWNYQGGVRKSFYGDGGFPLEKEHLTFETAAGSRMTSEGYSEKHLLPPQIFIYNFFYYFFGRFSGIIWYYFPAVLALILFILRRKKPYQWFILGALTLEILTYIILMPDNYAGGAGALGNRYFLCIYPLFFFLVDFKEDIRKIALSWIVASVFISQILLSPLQHSHYPSTHTAKFPFKILPVELTLINNYPTSTNPNARSQKVGTEGSRLFFLDSNYLPRTVSERKNQVFITRGPHKAEMILKTLFPVKEITFTLKNNRRLNNEITVKFAGEKKSITLGREEQGTLIFTPKKAFHMSENTYLYKLSIKAAKASIPYFEVQESGEKRYLGVSYWLEPVGQ